MTRVSAKCGSDAVRVGVSPVIFAFLYSYRGTPPNIGQQKPRKGRPILGRIAVQEYKTAKITGERVILR